MKSRSAASIACCAALLSLIVPLIAKSASKNLVLTDAEPQYASKLCWAAADVLAVNQFYPHCPAPTAATPALFPTSQALDAGFNAWFYSGTHSSPPTSGDLSSCQDNNNIQGLICNTWGNPRLYGLTFKWGKTPRP
jgi:hypothetical protein